MTQNLQLQPLCNLILERTINDPDKYQSGLTKIFFRAGMLAALESLRSGRLNALVTVVQKNMRRRMAVKKYKELRQATIKIQTWWRGILARRFVESVRRTTAACRLQTAARRFVQRRRFVDIRTGIIRLQSREYILTGIIYLNTPTYTLDRRSWCSGTTYIQGLQENACCHSPAEPLTWSVSSKAIKFVTHTNSTSTVFRGNHSTWTSSVLFTSSHV